MRSIRIKCGVFKGDTKAVFVDRREFTGSVCELIEQAHDYILAKINMGCYFKGAFRHDRYELPPDEMRELVINAFAHRSYRAFGRMCPADFLQFCNNPAM